MWAGQGQVGRGVAVALLANAKEFLPRNFRGRGGENGR